MLSGRPAATTGKPGLVENAGVMLMGIGRDK
jgi:hypothetical protein